jgi:hypothetical protein
MKCSKVKLYYKFSFEFDYRVLSGKLQIKEVCESDHSMNNKKHLALGMSTSEWLTPEGDREHTYKTTLRQSLCS